MIRFESAPRRSTEFNMRFFGWIFIILGTLWLPLPYMATAMMSRGVDYFTEAVLPSSIGFLVILLGVWMVTRPRDKPPAVPER